MREAREFSKVLDTPAAPAAARALLASGEAGGLGFLRALARPSTRLGPEGANGRAVMEDIESFCIDFARAFPEAYLRGIAKEPLASMFALVSALRVVSGAEATHGTRNSKRGEGSNRRDPRSNPRHARQDAAPRARQAAA